MAISLWYTFLHNILQLDTESFLQGIRVASILLKHLARISCSIQTFYFWSWFFTLTLILIMSFITTGSIASPEILRLLFRSLNQSQMAFSLVMALVFIFPLICKQLPLNYELALSCFSVQFLISVLLCPNSFLQSPWANLGLSLPPI